MVGIPASAFVAHYLQWPTDIKCLIFQRYLNTVSPNDNGYANWCLFKPLKSARQCDIINISTNYVSIQIVVGVARCKIFSRTIVIDYSHTSNISTGISQDIPRQTSAFHLFAGVMYAFHLSKYWTQNLYDCLKLPTILLFLKYGDLTSIDQFIKIQLWGGKNGIRWNR